MRVRRIRYPALLAAGLFVIAACTPEEAASPAPTPGPDSAAQGAVLASADQQAPMCSDGSAGDIAGWPVGADTDVAFVPVLTSSVVTVGPNRILYNVLDPAYRQLAAPDVASTIAFYAIERDPDTPTDEDEADFLSSGLGRGLYRAQADFDCVGEWGAEISITQPDGETASERFRFSVGPAGDTPAIGEPVPHSDSLTATTPEDVARISTDLNPYLPAYDKTIAQTVASGRPSLVFFATPAFCQTGFCGPTVELVKSVAREYEGEVEFVNVEPYELQMTENGLQPRLDAEGRLQPVQAALDYGIPVEPYLFLVDAEGRAFARFEVVIGGEELRAVIEDVLTA